MEKSVARVLSPLKQQLGPFLSSSVKPLESIKAPGGHLPDATRDRFLLSYFYTEKGWEFQVKKVGVQMPRHVKNLEE